MEYVWKGIIRLATFDLNFEKKNGNWWEWRENRRQEDCIKKEHSTTSKNM